MPREIELLNWQQACKILNCSRSYFYNLVNSGKIKAIRLGKKNGIRVEKNECIKYVLVNKIK